MSSLGFTSPVRYVNREKSRGFVRRRYNDSELRILASMQTINTGCCYGPRPCRSMSISIMKMWL